MGEWYYGKGGQQEGPFDEATLRQRVASGQVNPTDLVWREGMAEWLPLSQVAELSSSSSVVAPSSGVVPASPYAPPETNPAVVAASYTGAPATSGLAIASLVFGILALVSSCIYVGIIFGIPAVICGHMAMKKIAELQNPVGGKGLALAGLICGYIGSLLSLVTIGFVVFVLNATDGGIQEIIENMERQQSENQERIEESQRQVEDAGENAH